MKMVLEGDSRRQVLTQLLEHKSGTTVDEVITSVGLSRTAVNQHLMVLEREGYVRKAASRRTGGRPGRVYVLTEDGTNLFPKKYAWFSRLLIQTLREQLGEEQLGRYMYDLGVKNVSRPHSSTRRKEPCRARQRDRQDHERDRISGEYGFV